MFRWINNALGNTSVKLKLSLGFGLVLVLTGGLGLVTPPVGSVLFIGTAIGKISVGQSMHTIWPFWFAALAVLLVVAFFPSLSLWLPAALRG